MLKATRKERGSAPVEATFAIIFLMVLVLGALQYALTLYARNVVLAAAHEGARAAIEVGRNDHQARVTAEQAVQRAAGGVVRHLRVSVRTMRTAREVVATVRVEAALEAMGPVPVRVPISVAATSSREQVPR